MSQIKCAVFVFEMITHFVIWFALQKVIHTLFICFTHFEALLASHVVYFLVKTLQFDVYKASPFGILFILNTLKMW